MGGCGSSQGKGPDGDTGAGRLSLLLFGSTSRWRGSSALAFHVGRNFVYCCSLSPLSGCRCTGSRESSCPDLFQWSVFN